jgi:hypothetical protein
MAAGRLFLAVLFLCALLGMGLWAQTGPRVPIRPDGAPPSLVLSGDDIGFRVYGHDERGVLGRLVVKINGEWREVSAGVSILPIGK